MGAYVISDDDLRIEGDDNVSHQATMGRITPASRSLKTRAPNLQMMGRGRQKEACSLAGCASMICYCASVRRPCVRSPFAVSLAWPVCRRLLAGRLRLHDMSLCFGAAQ